ncbi:MAG TPA: XRE family transcriptional regulator [Clostridia bacterium]|nr:XRE family transcriptional regulator [Clostridia bacterium]HQM39913.1 XRE family transcriptional regulator [Clostridia bacterium]
MDIGGKIKQLRLLNSLTQQELADRSELSKGYISQLERNIITPTITTLQDVLTGLGTNLADFFSGSYASQIVYKKKDMVTKKDETEGRQIMWVVPDCQKNSMEPIIMTLQPGGISYQDDPHEGEEFGFVLEGNIKLEINDKKYTVTKGQSFYFKSDAKHLIRNTTGKKAVVLWVTTPPSF